MSDWFADITRRRRQSRAIADQQVTLTTCPLCAATDFEPAFARNNLAARFDIDRRLSRADYVFCRNCGGLFAQRRETASVAEAYYELFPDIEERGYAKKVIPAHLRTGKRAAAAEVLSVLQARQALRPGMAVMHLRCDAGSLLTAIGEAVPGAILHGLDYFPTNVQAAQESGLSHIALLSPKAVRFPFGRSYDLIIANHIFTHSLAPREDLETITRHLAPGGQVYFYNENDHDLIFDPASEFYSRMDMISFHKQLFDTESFSRFLLSGGLQGEITDRRKFTFGVLARALPEAGAAAPLAPVAFENRRKRAAAWAKISERNRYLLPLAKWARQHKSLKWLAGAAQRATAGRRAEKRPASSHYDT